MMLTVTLVLMALFMSGTNAWVPSSSVSSRTAAVSTRLFLSSEAIPLAEKEEEEEEEWEYVELEALAESDFVGSEWLVGTNWDSNPKQIKETWVRLVVDESGKNVAIWGDKSKGKWNLDVASQFFSISKETWGGWGGKKIWAGTVDDYYYLQGTIRGWSPISPASVLGQWQARRLGVDPDEAGTAPWFDEDYLKQQEELAKANQEKQQEMEQDGGIFEGVEGL